MPRSKRVWCCQEDGEQPEGDQTARKAQNGTEQIGQGAELPQESQALKEIENSKEGASSQGREGGVKATRNSQSRQDG